MCSLFISISFSNWLMILLLDYYKCLILCPSILFFLPGLVNGYNQGFFPICSTLFSKRFILLNSRLKVLKFYEKLIIRSTNVLIVL